MRARQRPRKASVNFRRIFRAVMLDAALRVVMPAFEVYPAQAQELRVQLWTRRRTVRVTAGIVLALHPERQHWPERRL